jgi:hypothetical protein
VSDELPTARVVVDGDPGSTRTGPRQIPRWLVVRLWFGAPFAFVVPVAALTLGLWLLPRIELVDAPFDTQTTGDVVTVTRRHHTDATIHYTFVERGHVHSGVSFASHDLSRGGHVPVEYVSGSPETSRVVGASTCPDDGVFVYVLVPIVLSMLLLHGIRQRFRGVHLLRYGRPTTGTLTKRHVTRGKGGGTVFKTYDYTAHDGNGYQVRMRVLGDEHDGAAQIVYDPKKPRRAVCLKDEPGAPRVDGERVVGDARPAPHLLILPLLVLAGLVANIILIATPR